MNELLEEALQQYSQWEAARTQIAEMDFNALGNVVVTANRNVAVANGWFMVDDNEVNLTEIGHALLWHRQYEVTPTDDGNLLVRSDKYRDQFGLEFESDETFVVRMYEPTQRTSLRTGEIVFDGYRKLGTVSAEEGLSREIAWQHKRAQQNRLAGDQKRQQGVAEHEIPFYERNPRSLEMRECRDRYAIFLAMRFTKIAIQVDFLGAKSEQRLRDTINDRARRALWVKAGFSLTEFPKKGKD